MDASSSSSEDGNNQTTLPDPSMHQMPMQAATTTTDNTATATIAYAISVTHCPVNKTYTILDGAAVLGHSIHINSIRGGVNNSNNNANVNDNASRNASRSRYDYALYAFVHIDAMECAVPLTQLGYTVIASQLPFQLDQLPYKLRFAMEQKGCCGAKEFLKLNVFSLTNHPIAVHLDSDTLIVQPMDPLWDSLLLQDQDDDEMLPSSHLASIQHHHSNKNTNTTSRQKMSSLDFLFTRDYHQQSQYSTNPKHYGVQGGFLVVRPNQTLLEELTDRLRNETFTKKGWSNRGYSGYWGASQIQGYLSYVVGEYMYADTNRALELNRCLYNSMINDDPLDEHSGKCRTGEKICDDCRVTPWEDVYSVHLTTCRKPWECPFLRTPQPLLCRTAHRAWFDTRRKLELEWKQRLPKGGWKAEWTLGYCTKPKNATQRVYLPLQLPPVPTEPPTTTMLE
jgi:hypothetical protein